VVALFHLARLSSPQQSVPTAAEIYGATMHLHASSPPWFVLRCPCQPLYVHKLGVENLDELGSRRRTSSSLARRSVVWTRRCLPWSPQCLAAGVLGAATTDQSLSSVWLCRCVWVADAQAVLCRDRDGRDCLNARLHSRIITAQGESSARGIWLFRRWLP